MTNNKRDRDAIVDRLLAGAMTGGSTASGSACLDVETVAAWADNALDARELAAAEMHAADCARCQAMLAAMVKAAPTSTHAATSPWRIPSLGWLVPLTAAAAAVIVWIVVPSSSPTRSSSPASATDVVAPPSAPTVSEMARPEQQAPAEAKDTDLSRRTAPGAKTQADKKAAASPDANAVSDAPAISADARLDKMRSATGGAASPTAAEPLASTATSLSARAPETVVVSPNPANRWRILPGGAVQRSADGGATWQTQNTGVTETLSAGVSPSPSVCWLVGAGGIVLLSTDGQSWKRVAFPEAVPLVAARATDGQTAVVTSADAREFATEDGGRTWRRTR